MNPFVARLTRCMERMQEQQITQLLVTSTPNLYYLTGQKMETGERMKALLLIPGANPRLFLHQMFSEEINLPDGVELILWQDEDDPVKRLADCLSEGEKLAVDQNWPSCYLIDLQRSLPLLSVQKSEFVEKLREIKDDTEVNILRQASRIADAVLHQVIQLQHFPATERQMAETIRSFFGEHQVQELSFTPIIGFGKNSANPHHVISDSGLFPDQAMVVDMGGVYQHYCSDITRTFFYGRPNGQFEEIFKIVKEAQEKAIAMVKPGVTFADIDRTIRDEFGKWGYEQRFIHRTGHGIGLELHEGPFLHQANHGTIEAGMVFSIEPGIYLPGQFGVRIEDIVSVTASGCELLTLSPKEVHYLEIQEFIG